MDHLYDLDVSVEPRWQSKMEDPVKSCSQQQNHVGLLQSPIHTYISHHISIAQCVLIRIGNVYT